jgi:hypothetical protein
MEDTPRDIFQQFGLWCGCPWIVWWEADMGLHLYFTVPHLSLWTLCGLGEFHTKKPKGRVCVDSAQTYLDLKEKKKLL